MRVAAQRRRAAVQIGKSDEKSGQNTRKLLKVNQRSVISIQGRGAVMLKH
jgi:hypothetical protein